jgi:hypothetical protein
MGGLPTPGLPAGGAGAGEGADAGEALVSTDAEEDEKSSSLAETRRVTPRDAMGEARGDTRAWRGADRAGARRAPECAMTRAATGAVMHIISRSVPTRGLQWGCGEGAIRHLARESHPRSFEKIFRLKKFFARLFGRDDFSCSDIWVFSHEHCNHHFMWRENF